MNTTLMKLFLTSASALFLLTSKAWAVVDDDDKTARLALRAVETPRKEGEHNAQAAAVLPQSDPVSASATQSTPLDTEAKVVREVNRVARQVSAAVPVIVDAAQAVRSELWM